jgi:hypothetical protein
MTILKNKNSIFKYINNIAPIAIFYLYIATLVLFELMFGPGGYIILAKKASINPLPYFADLDVLLTGLDAIRNGLDPYTTPWKGFGNIPWVPVGGINMFNYPKSIGYLSYFPFLTADNLFIIGFTLAFLFSVAVGSLFQNKSLRDAIYCTLIIISPAVMLGIDRGNYDVFIFVLIVFSIRLIQKRLYQCAIFLLLGMIKLFPIAGLLYLSNSPKKRSSIILFILFSIIFGLHFIANYENWMLVSAKTPRPMGTAAYGLGPIVSFIILKINTTNLYEYIHPINLKLILVFTLALVFSAISHIVFFKDPFRRIKLSINQDYVGNSYIIGSSIFIFTCIIGYNWDYRLIFLILTIPQIMVWMSKNYMFGKILFLTTLLIMWKSFTEQYVTHYFIYINAAIIVVLFYLHILFVTEFIRNYINKFEIPRQNEEI